MRQRSAVTQMRVVSVVLLLVFLSACGGSTDGLFGEGLWQQTCQSCHGRAAEGGTGPGLGLGTDAATFTHEQLVGVVRAGPGAMPSYPQLTDEQVDSVIEYLRFLQGVDE